MDIFIGSIIGVVFTLFCMYISDVYKGKNIENMKFENKDVVHRYHVYAYVELMTPTIPTNISLGCEIFARTDWEAEDILKSILKPIVLHVLDIKIIEVVDNNEH